jgi:MFS family permease
MGYTANAAQALTIPPNVLAFFVILLTTWLSDRFRTRSIPIIILCLTSAFGYIMLAGAGSLQHSLNNLPDEVAGIEAPSRWWEAQMQAGAQMVSTSSLTAMRYVGITFAAATIFSIVAIVIVWNGNNSETETSRGAGMALLQMLGQCGPLLGTRLYPDSQGPEYVQGSLACAGSMVIVCILVGVQRWRLKRINRRRDKEEIMAQAESVDGRRVEKRFRFML